MNHDRVEMLDQPIPPESQLIADQSRANDDILLSNSENDTDVSSMDELSESQNNIQTKKP